MARRPDRPVLAYDRWVRTEETTQSTPELQVAGRLQAGRKLGHRRLARLVASVRQAPERGLLEALTWHRGHVMAVEARLLPGRLDSCRQAESAA